MTHNLFDVSKNGGRTSSLFPDLDFNLLLLFFSSFFSFFFFFFLFLFANLCGCNEQLLHCSQRPFPPHHESPQNNWKHQLRRFCRSQHVIETCWLHNTNRTAQPVFLLVRENSLKALCMGSLYLDNLSSYVLSSSTPYHAHTHKLCKLFMHA